MTENGNGNSKSNRNGSHRLFEPVLVFLKLLLGWQRQDKISGNTDIIDYEDVLDDLDDRLDEPDNPRDTEN